MIPTFIQAVPWEPRRARNAVRLREEAPGTVVWDSEFSGFATFKSVMTSMGSGPGILLEDDVVLCENWRERIESVIGQYPDQVIRFFGTSEREPGIIERRGGDFAMNQCVYYPEGLPQKFLSFVKSRNSKMANDYHDIYFGIFLRRTGRNWLDYAPSLVQHLDWASEIMPKRSRKRQSPSFQMKEVSK